MTTDEQKWADLYALLRGAISKIEQIRREMKHEPAVKTRGQLAAEKLLTTDGHFENEAGCHCGSLDNHEDVGDVEEIIANAIDRTAAEAVAEALAKERREIAEMLGRFGYTSIASDVAKRK